MPRPLAGPFVGEAECSSCELVYDVCIEVGDTVDNADAIRCPNCDYFQGKIKQ